MDEMRLTLRMEQTPNMRRRELIITERDNRQILIIPMKHYYESAGEQRLDGGKIPSHRMDEY